MYRYPKDDVQTNFNFYQRNYQERWVTDLPTLEDLSAFLATGFKGTELEASKSVKIVKQQIEGGRLLDYGCSWGYQVYQFGQEGFDALGFDVSKERARYGRKNLGVDIIDDYEGLEALETASVDVIHASHVLEHLPEPKTAFKCFQRLLKRKGVLVIFVPNAGGKAAREQGTRWGPMIGEKHCLALDAAFFANALPAYGLRPVFSSWPYDRPLISLNVAGDEVGAAALDGGELLVVATREG